MTEGEIGRWAANLSWVPVNDRGYYPGRRARQSGYAALLATFITPAPSRRDGFGLCPKAVQSEKSPR